MLSWCEPKIAQGKKLQCVSEKITSGFSGGYRERLRSATTEKLFLIKVITDCSETPKIMANVSNCGLEMPKVWQWPSENYK